jgi:two-component system chemotaxis sensor kinase CheA
MSDFQVSAELLSIYLEDARGHLEALDQCLLALERDGFDAEAVASVLRPLHTLKGNSGMMGFSGIKEYVHRLEDVFGRIAENLIPFTPELFDRLFAGASALRDALEQACQEGSEGRSLERERGELESWLAATAGSASATAPALIRPRTPAPPASRSEAGAASVAGPSSSQPTSPEEEAPPGPRGADARYVSVRSSMVRVNFAQLDNLLNMVGELIIYRTKLEQVGKAMAERLGGRGAGADLLDAVQHVAGVASQLQETVMDIRMLPVRHIFDRFPRLVRDLARQEGKEIELILEGENTRVDKAIIDEIAEPLVHMIRNSVDHGIEPPALRIARGKTPTGTILLSAAQESNSVVLTIMDDGAGIDAETVRRMAISRGLLKGDEVLTEREIVQLIFAQGFSTAAAVSEISGRGVGLDAVLKSIERLNGLIEVESVPGVGTKFIIQLPLTLAIISALMVEVAGTTYAIPLASVVESMKFRPHEVHEIGGRDTLRIRDRIVPLFSLADVFGLPRPETEERHYVVILGRGEKRIGLAVERLRGQQEVVIKALDPFLGSSGVALAGATIMGDGRVVLILDVAALFDGKRRGRALTRADTGALLLGGA